MDAQADLSLYWAQISESKLYFIAAHDIYFRAKEDESMTPWLRLRSGYKTPCIRTGSKQVFVWGLLKPAWNSLQAIAATSFTKLLLASYKVQEMPAGAVYVTMPRCTRANLTAVAVVSTIWM